MAFAFSAPAALLTYIIPSSTLIIPFHRVMHTYGVLDNPWAVIAAEVTFATPYAILVLLHAAKLIPMELDDAARIDGASVVQLYLRIYVPLMAPALAAVGTYALLFAWNDYFYQYMLLTSERNTTVAMALEQFFDDDDAPWNYHDGDCDPLFAAADCDLLCVAPLYGGGINGKRHQGLKRLGQKHRMAVHLEARRSDPSVEGGRAAANGLRPMTKL